MQIKMCGMTRPQDALAAAELGADAIGLVFVRESPRCVSPSQAQEIVRGLPASVARVGVFVNEAPDTVRARIDELGLTAVQLHGDEDEAYVRALDPAVPVIKALAFGPGLESRMEGWPFEAVLVDHATPTQRGGTGYPWDWSELEARHRPSYLMVAGGLNAHNVGDAIRALQPDAVDVASGIESQPGIKDQQKMKAFMAACEPYRKGRRPFLS